MRNNMGRWTTKNLLAEVLIRSEGDAPGLRALGAMVIRAQLAESDRQAAELGDSTGVGSKAVGAGVMGTTEITIANDDQQGRR